MYQRLVCHSHVHWFILIHYWAHLEYIVIESVLEKLRRSNSSCTFWLVANFIHLYHNWLNISFQNDSLDHADSSSCCTCSCCCGFFSIIAHVVFIATLIFTLVDLIISSQFSDYWYVSLKSDNRCSRNKRISPASQIRWISPHSNTILSLMHHYNWN